MFWWVGHVRRLGSGLGFGFECSAYVWGGFCWWVNVVVVSHVMQIFRVDWFRYKIDEWL